MNLAVPKEFKSDNFLKDLDFLKSSFNVFFNLVDNELTKHMLEIVFFQISIQTVSKFERKFCEMIFG